MKVVQLRKRTEVPLSDRDRREREQTIVEMLRRYTEAREPSVVGSLGEKLGPGDRNNMGMPDTWNDSYRRLEGFLSLMREDPQMRSRWWHVTQRYIYADVLTLEVPFRKTPKGPVPKLPPHTELVAGASEVGEFASRVRVRRWDPKVREDKVRKAVTLLAEMFENEPYLPAEFQVAA